MNSNLFKAILAMDSYNRGYGAGIDLRIKNSNGEYIEDSDTIYTINSVKQYAKIGNSTVYDTKGDVAAQAAGFYGISYQLAGGEKVISYRGTDTAPQLWAAIQSGDLSKLLTPDVLNGYGVGAGSLVVKQAELAIKFYQSVAGAESDWRSANISVTGHSLGGGLAGLVGSLYNRTGLLFNNMAYQSAADNAYKYSTDHVVAYINPISGLPESTTIPANTALKTLIYGTGSAVASNYVNLNTIYMQDEFLTTNRLLQTGGKIPVNLGYDASSNLSGTQLHSMATMVMQMYANTEVVDRSWEKAAKYFWPVAYDNGFADSIGMNTTLLSGRDRTNGEYAAILRQIIAYSAIDEGTRVFGDTGIRAFYNDANDFGRVVTANPASGILTNYAEHISKVFVEYAADLALNKIESAKVSFGFIQPLNGVLQFFGSGNVLAMDFSKDVWSAAGDSDITSRRLFVDGLIGDPTATYRPIRDLMNAVWGTSSSDIFDVAYIVQNGSAASMDTLYNTSAQYPTNKYTITAIDGRDTQFNLDRGAHNLALIDSGNSIVGGGNGNDIFVITAYASGNKGIAGGSGFDTVSYTLQAAPYGMTVSYDRSKVTAQHFTGIDTLNVDVERIELTSYSDSVRITDSYSIYGRTWFGGAGTDHFIIDSTDIFDMSNFAAYKGGGYNSFSGFETYSITTTALLIDGATQLTKYNDIFVSTAQGTIRTNIFDYSPAEYAASFSFNDTIGHSVVINGHVDTFPYNSKFAGTNNGDTISVSGNLYGSTLFISGRGDDVLTYNAASTNFYYVYTGGHDTIYSANGYLTYALLDPSITLTETSVTRSGSHIHYTFSNHGTLDVYMGGTVPDNEFYLGFGTPNTQYSYSTSSIGYMTSGGTYVLTNVPDGIIITGMGGDDILNGTAAANTMNGYMGNDSIYGLGGNDTIDGGTGHDYLSGGAGDDRITDSFGNNAIEGGVGNDTLYGGIGNDTYKFNIGDGQDNIFDRYGIGNVISFGAGITKDNIRLASSQDSFHSLIIYYGAGDTITVLRHFQYTYEQNFVSISAINFSDGTFIDLSKGVPLHGTSGVDNIGGSSGDDQIYGLAGDDNLAGAKGDDRIYGGAGSDNISGQEGIDTAVFSGKYLNYTISPYLTYYLKVQDNVGSDGIDYVYNDVEKLEFTDGIYQGGTFTYFGQINGTVSDDVIVGTAHDDAIFGYSGNDNLLGNDANDTLDGGVGNDTLEGGNGDDYIIGGDGVDTVSYAQATAAVTVNIATITAQNTIGAGTDTITTVENILGSAFGDTLVGNSSANSIDGGAGNDTVQGGLGNDTLIGGLGLDTASYSLATTGVTVNLSLATAQNTVGAGTDTLTGFENLLGTGYNDTLTGNTVNNTIDGGNGNDVIDGGNGDDNLIGGTGVDTLSYKTAASAVTVSLSGSGTQNTLGGGTDSFNGFENLLGSAYNDTLTGDANANTVEGGLGNDTLSGGLGVDTASYAGATAAVTVNLSLTTAQNTVGAGTDTLTGFENLLGSSYNDTLTGDTANNTIDGGSGNDLLQGGLGNDILIGGLGTDTASYSSATAGVTISLALNTSQNTVNAGLDTLSGIENLTGSTYNDTLTGDVNANVIDGGAGNDTINSGDGNDTLSGGLGDDSLVGGNGVDTVTYAGATAAVTVKLAQTTAQNTIGYGIDTLSGFENLTGSAYNDTLTGDANVNVIDGGAGNDTIEGGAGNDTLKGGSGTDRLVYASSTAAVTVNLATTTAQNTVGAGTDTISGFEDILGSAYNDTLTGDANANTIEGGLGNDVLNGAAGTDTVSYSSATAGVSVNLSLTTAQNTVGSGTDTLSNFENVTGSNYNDNLFGSTLANRQTGGLGNDNLYGSAGADVLDGGAGWDTVSYAASTVAVNVNLATNTHTGGDAAGDSLIGIESVTGSSYNDTIRGTTAADSLFGAAGADTLYGGAGNDVLSGGAGADILWGEVGADMFKFDTSSFGTIDTVKDFKLSDSDKIDISGILIGYDPLTKAITDFIECTTSGANTVVKIDRDGAGTAYTWQQVATFENVTGLTDEATLKANGTIVV